MPARVPLEGILVIRDGKRMQPKIGEPFDFTDDEIEHLETRRPSALREIVVEEAPAFVAGKPHAAHKGKRGKPADDDL